MMKTAAAFLLILPLLLSAAACSGQEVESPKPKSAATLPPSSEPTAVLALSPSLEETMAASIRGIEFTMGDLVRRIRVIQGINRFQGEPVDLDTAPFVTLRDLVNAEILRQEASALGIKPSNDAIETGLRQQFQPTAPDGQQASPEQLKREFQNNYQIFLAATGLTDSEYRIVLEEKLTRDGLVVLLAQDIESPLEQVEVRWIRLPPDLTDAGASELQPEQMTQRLKVEDFESVARDVSRPAGYADDSGYVGWVPKGAFPDLDPLLYGDNKLGRRPMTPGETSGPWFTNGGIYIINMLSGPALNELTDKMRVKLTAELVKDWQDRQLMAGMGDGSISMNFNSELYEWVAEQVSRTQPAGR